MSASPSASVSASDRPPQKKLRKGTHSCMECRRRKKSCVPRQATPGTCEECFIRGVQCRDQEVSLGRKRTHVGKHDLQQRVTELETALLSISHKLDTTSAPIEHDNNAREALQQPHPMVLPYTPVTPPDSEVLLKHAPVLSLFDNAILSREPDDNTRTDSYSNKFTGSEAIDPTTRIGSIGRALKAFFPSKQKQDIILNASNLWWSTWQDIYPQIFGQEPPSSVKQIVADWRSSGSVQKIAKALLCLLVILQEGPPKLDTSDDLAFTTIQTSRALSIIDGMVLNDDGLAGTIDGIECIVLRAKYESSAGRIRKAWLFFRRGISLAQLAGLHKSMPNVTKDTSHSRRREGLWKALYSSDRFLSLMLGLPYGPSEIHSDIGRDSEGFIKGIPVENSGEHYFFRLANIVGHIIDRNQQLPSNNMLPLTFKIENELMELAGSMKSDWWEYGREPGAAAKPITNLLLPQFWHHQARSLLHLPFMLKGLTDQRFEFSKMAAVESAREMIIRYCAIRPAHGYGSLICKMIDFQVFTAAMILVLNLLDHYRKSETVGYSEADNDQDLIVVVTDILHRASVETDGGVATQAARALEDFGEIKEMPLPLPIEESEGRCITKVVIPYIGAVMIGPGASLKEQVQMQRPESTLQSHQLPTPSEQSLDASSPESAPPSNPLIEPLVMPYDFNNGGNSDDLGVSGDFFANIDLDLDQDWDWFWNNTNIPSVDPQ